jgi:hypothetical protein
MVKLGHAWTGSVTHFHIFELWVRLVTFPLVCCYLVAFGQLGMRFVFLVIVYCDIPSLDTYA